MDLQTVLRLILGGEKKIRERLFKDESGAVTVEWVVLTSAVVALAAGIGNLLIGDGDNTMINTLREILVNALDQATTVTID